jgi:hypothetical protein
MGDELLHSPTPIGQGPQKEMPISSDIMRWPQVLRLMEFGELRQREVLRMHLIRSLGHGVYAYPRSGSWPTEADSRTSHVHSQNRYVRILRDGV